MKYKVGDLLLEENIYGDEKVYAAYLHVIVKITGDRVTLHLIAVQFGNMNFRAANAKDKKRKVRYLTFSNSSPQWRDTII